MNVSHQYRVLQERLKRDIIGGIYQVGENLPSENELSKKENIARSTVRNALAQLEKEGYIVKKRGKGSIVSSTRRALGILNYQGFSASAGVSLINTISVEEPHITTWPSGFYFNISDEEKLAACITFSRVRFIEKDPVMWETSYVSDQNLPRFTQRYRTKKSFFSFLAKAYQIEITGMNQEIKAIAAKSHVAIHLKLKVGTPILLIYRKYFTNRPQLNIYSILYCSTEKYAMSNENQ